MNKIMIILTVLCLLCGCRQVQFDGSRISNENKFVMEYEVLNREYYHVFELNANDVIEVNIVDEAGELSIVIQNEKEEIIYQGNDLPTSHFQVTVHQNGSYKIIVSGHKAKGSVSFVIKK